MWYNTTASNSKPTRCQQIHQLYKRCGCSDPIEVIHGDNCKLITERNEWTTQAEQAISVMRRQMGKCPSVENLWVVDDRSRAKCGVSRGSHHKIAGENEPPGFFKWLESTLPSGEGFTRPQNEINGKVAYWNMKIEEQRERRAQEEVREKAARQADWDKQIQEHKEGDDRNGDPQEDRFEMIRPGRLPRNLRVKLGLEETIMIVCHALR